ncbi:hypothetical protein HPB51_019821 [Rhipicephalus microplus]|uniref:Tick transposon n=1 Tax=Rhipicephalus microplus TaxID=6941 RepID=A0A9J6DPE4_RHIMP|nr:hypothetical protein HPB51_019821 [Rhipicephalus microplus]
MDVESPWPPPIRSASSVATLRKRSGHPSDVDSEDTLMYSTASDESSDESDFVPVARHKAKRRLLTTSPSQSKATTNIQEPPVHTILFVPLNAADSMNRLNRQVTSMSLEALVPGQITNVRINGRKNVLAIDVTQRTALDVLTKVFECAREHQLRPFAPKPLQCRKCCKIGHVSAVCTSSAVCSRCSESHNTEACQAEHRKCGNCQGPHEASSKQCPNVKKEMQVLRQLARDGSTHREAAAKVRCRRSRHRKTPRTSSAKVRDTPLPHITHSLPQASTSANNEDPQKDARNIDPDAWPALPSVTPPVEPQHRPLKTTSERLDQDLFSPLSPRRSDGRAELQRRLRSRGSCPLPLDTARWSQPPLSAALISWRRCGGKSWRLPASRRHGLIGHRRSRARPIFRRRDRQQRAPGSKLPCKHSTSPFQRLQPLTTVVVVVTAATAHLVSTSAVPSPLRARYYTTLLNAAGVRRCFAPRRRARFFLARGGDLRPFLRVCVSVCLHVNRHSGGPDLAGYKSGNVEPITSLDQDLFSPLSPRRSDGRAQLQRRLRSRDSCPLLLDTARWSQPPLSAALISWRRCGGKSWRLPASRRRHGLIGHRRSRARPIFRRRDRQLREPGSKLPCKHSTSPFQRLQPLTTVVVVVTAATAHLVSTSAVPSPLRARYYTTLLNAAGVRRCFAPRRRARFFLARGGDLRPFLRVCVSVCLHVNRHSGGPDLAGYTYYSWCSTEPRKKEVRALEMQQ